MCSRGGIVCPALQYVLAAATTAGTTAAILVGLFAPTHICSYPGHGVDAAAAGRPAGKQWVARVEAWKLERSTVPHQDGLGKAKLVPNRLQWRPSSRVKQSAWAAGAMAGTCTLQTLSLHVLVWCVY